MAKERRPKAISPFTPYIQGNSKFILGLKNVFSEQECQELIHRSEQHVYESALVNFGGTGYVVDKTARDSDRVMLDDPTAAAEIFCRVRPWVPEHIDGCNVCGVNERLRFLRYNAAQQFAPHYDGCYERPDGRELSFLTIQVSSLPGYFLTSKCENSLSEDSSSKAHTYRICLATLLPVYFVMMPLRALQHTLKCPCALQVYLNGHDLEGGETTFFDDEGNEQCKIRPYARLVVLFDHNILHEGSPVRQGRKYVIRSDIMYSRPVAAGDSSRG